MDKTQILHYFEHNDSWMTMDLPEKRTWKIIILDGSGWGVESPSFPFYCLLFKNTWVSTAFFDIYFSFF